MLVHHQLVIHAKLALGHATQEALHDDSPRNMGRQNLTYDVEVVG